MNAKLARFKTAGAHDRVSASSIVTNVFSRHSVQITLLGAPLLLLVPVLYYSLTTPFSLIDDYLYGSELQALAVFDDVDSFLDWCHRNFVSSEMARFRPFWELANGFALAVYGTMPWLHHLSRWLLHLASIAMFVSAVAITLKSDRKGVADTAASASVLIPIALMVHIWIFFPNSPVSRLQPQEIHTVFFLGLCNWMAALLLTEPVSVSPVRIYLIRTLLCFGCLGLSWSKEVNVSLAACMFLFQLALLLWRKRRLRLESVASTLLFSISAFAAIRVYASSRNAGVGYGKDLAEVDFVYNVRTVFNGLFQRETSTVILLVLLCLSVASLVVFVRSWRRRGLDATQFFLAFLFVQGAALFLALSFSWSVVPRYWYPLIPLLAMAMGFSAYFVVGAASRLSLGTTRVAKVLLLAFIGFYIACNYSNFLFQTITQHRGGSLDQRTVQVVTRLLEDGEPVWIARTGYEHEDKLIGHFNGSGFLLTLDAEHEHVRTKRPVSLPYYYQVTRSAPAGEATLVWAASSRRSYAIFSIASKISAFLQGGGRHLSTDAGALLPSPLEYQWSIYRVEVDRSRIIEADFDVDFDRRTRSLILVKNPCTPTDFHAHFTLHVVAQDRRDHLPQPSGLRDFDNLDFAFQERGRRLDHHCVAEIQLPSYPIRYIVVGATTPDGEGAWARTFFFDEQRRGNATGT